MFSAIEQVFQPILGQMAWSCSEGDGPALSFEFGEPALSAAKSSPTGRRLRVVVSGRWQLWVSSERWTVASDGMAVTERTKRGPLVVRVLHRMDGQRLIRVIDDARHLALEFDHGGRLAIIYSDDGDQWTIYRRGDTSVTLQGDRSLLFE